MNGYKPPNEGDLYKTIKLDGHVFELCFGYYEEFEKMHGEPVIIFPDLKNNPVYTHIGQPLVTVIQDPCEYYRVKDGCIPEERCGDCIYYKDDTKEIEVCLCEKQRKNVPEVIKNEKF